MPYLARGCVFDHDLSRCDCLNARPDADRHRKRDIRCTSQCNAMVYVPVYLFFTCTNIHMVTVYNLEKKFDMDIMIRLFDLIKYSIAIT